MTTIAYHASQEQFSPAHLLELAIKAEKAGFDAIHSSDHFHPWSKRQGQSGFTFSWIAAAMQATSLPFSMVCAPGQRYHPAIVAQAIATMGELFPGRFSIELGSGEALNECITGEPWPEKPVRNRRLFESAQVIRRLLAGEEVSVSGYIHVKDAKLYTLPLSLPPLFGCALTLETARWLGEWADGLLTTGGDCSELQARVAAFRENGGREKPVYVQLAFSYARESEVAVMSAWDQWRSTLVPMEKLADFTTPGQFDEASKDITPDEVVNKIPMYTSVEGLQEHIGYIEACCGPDRIILHNVNHYQENFIEDFAVIAERRKAATVARD
jgi:coenzyme F420-dependent glucose-6-phosphate dehydrogenase